MFHYFNCEKFTGNKLRTIIVNNLLGNPLAENNFLDLLTVAAVDFGKMGQQGQFASDDC